MELVIAWALELGCLNLVRILPPPCEVLSWLTCKIVTVLEWLLRGVNELINMKWYLEAMVVSCAGNGDPCPSQPTGLGPGSKEDLDNAKRLCAPAGTVTGCQSAETGSPGCLSQTLTFPCTLETGIYYQGRRFRPQTSYPSRCGVYPSK